jgi:2-polyprenyl-6-methoxyphenol hydroxylase-like FAD-dependent oxidoreductase
MKIAIVGGGPSGLYLALLLRRQRSDWDVQVVEQNAPGATFGFGVVMADTGLMQLRDADAASYEAMAGAMHYNHSQVIVQREVPIQVLRNVKGGAIERLALLRILQGLCEQAGVKLHHGQRISDMAGLEALGLADADVVVGADGINSVVRSQFAREFGTTQQTLSNHFAWYGTERVFETPALVFRTFNGGHFVAHYYPYNERMSTFVAECDDATWNRLGLGRLSDDDRQQLFEQIYAPELKGMPLISNKSAWRQFPVIRNRHWHHDRHVLIGDALTSAHFSIGSGTRIAMTDAIALANALLAHDGDTQAALAAYEHTHRPQKNKLIAASERSYNWYERIGEWMERYTPEEFVYQFMTRTGRVDDKRLREEFPALMERLDTGRVAAKAGA